MRVLIVRTGALGDVVHGLPVLTALRRARPQAHIGWLIEKRWAPLLAGHPDLDELLTVELKQWRKQPLAAATRHGLGALLAALDRFAPEVVLDLMGNHKAGLLAALTMADHRIGLARRFRREPSSAWWMSEPVVPRGDHAVERALAVLDGLGIDPGPVDFGGAKLFQGARIDTDVGSDAGSDAERGFALIHPGAAWANKCYPADRWGDVARQLAAHGVAVRVTGGPGEETLVERVVAAAAGAASPVAAASLPALGALIRRAGIVLGGDTGPIHLAHALGAPVLMVMGPTDPATHGPYGAVDRALALQLPCSFCHQRLDGPRACLLRLSPQTVAHRCLELMGSR